MGHPQKSVVIRPSARRRLDPTNECAGGGGVLLPNTDCRNRLELPKQRNPGIRASESPLMSRPNTDRFLMWYRRTLIAFACLWRGWLAFELLLSSWSTALALFVLVSMLPFGLMAWLAGRVDSRPLLLVAAAILIAIDVFAWSAALDDSASTAGVAAVLGTLVSLFVVLPLTWLSSRVIGCLSGSSRGEA